MKSDKTHRMQAMPAKATWKGRITLKTYLHGCRKMNGKNIV